MIKPVDKLGFGPTREAVKVPEGSLWEIRVTAPAFMNTPTQRILLTSEQYERYLKWQEGPGLIQDCLPDLSDSEREILMTGLNDEDFDEAATSADDHDEEEDDHE